MKEVLITCYVNPDLDGYAGVFAYSELLKKKGLKVMPRIVGEPHDEVKYILKRFSLPEIEMISDDSSFDKVILVDASDINGLAGKISPEKVVEIIDHRKINEADKFVNARVQIELVGAVATLIAEKFEQESIEISSTAALLLYSAIISNTLNFKCGVTTERDKEMALWLRKFIKIPDNYWRELFLAKSDLAGDKLASRIDGDFAWFELGGQKIGVAQLEIIGAEDLVKNRGEEVINILNRIKRELNLDLIFLNLIELEKEKNYFVTDDKKVKIILEKVLRLNFNGIFALRDNLIMRKQIVPLIKEELEK